MKLINYLNTLTAVVLTAISTWGQNPTDNTFTIAPHYIRPNIGDILPFSIGPTQGTGLYDDYNGDFATNCHNSMRNLDGELQFFIVDEKIYDAEGYLIEVLFNSSTYIKGTAETVIVPDPFNCNRYYIISVGRTDYTASSAKLPYYTVVDMTLDNPYYPGRKGAIDPSFVISNSTALPIADISPSHFIYDLKQGNCFIAASRERSNQSRFVYISNGLGIYRYKIDQNGLSYDNYHGFFNPAADQTASRGNGEMELIEVLRPVGNEYYRIAVPYETISPQGAATSIFTADLDINGEVIASSVQYFNFEHVFGNITGGLKRSFIHGLEFSPDGNILYVMHDINDFHPNNFEYIDFSEALPPIKPYYKHCKHSRF